MGGERFLLSGAGGFIGRALLRRLQAQGHEVVALCGERSPPPDGPGVEWRMLDLLTADKRAIERLVAASRVSHCLHTAWYTNHADYLVSEANRGWVAATLRLAEGFYAGGGKRFVGLGTCVE